MFRSFDEELRRPDWIMDELWEAIDRVGTGYVHLEGPAGVGKSYLARALRNDPGAEPALVHHIGPVTGAEYRTFISLLADEARVQLRWRTQEIQAAGQCAEGLRAQFREMLRMLMRANRRQHLVLVLDGLDNLSDSGDDPFGKIDFLPPASDLPSGLVIVLMGQPSLGRGIAERIRYGRVVLCVANDMRLGFNAKHRGRVIECATSKTSPRASRPSVRLHAPCTTMRATCPS